MQAARILSQEQRRTLESAYSFIRSATIYLTAHKYVCREADELQVSNLINFGVLVTSRLVEYFPEVKEWENRGGAK